MNIKFPCVYTHPVFGRIAVVGFVAHKNALVTSGGVLWPLGGSTAVFSASVAQMRAITGA